MREEHGLGTDFGGAPKYDMQTWVGTDGKTWVALYVDDRKFWDGTIEDLARKVIGLPRLLARERG